MEKILYIVRGIPGSGKSTFAKQLTANVFSEIKDAHKECQDNVRIAMESSIPKIAVSNTSTQEWEMESYFELAKEFGYDVFTIIVENRHGGTNVHNVPEDKIEQMKNRFSIKL